MDLNINYEYLYLNDIKVNEKNNTLIYNLNNSNSVSTSSQKWFINMELLEFKIEFTDLPINLDNSYEKIYILINELKSNDNLQYHFVCKTEKTINCVIIKPLNLYNFNTNKICLAIQKLTFSFYTYSKKLNKLNKLNIEKINSLPLELIIKYNNY